MHVSTHMFMHSVDVVCVCVCLVKTKRNLFYVTEMK